jgi:hypothetical protein
MLLDSKGLHHNVEIAAKLLLTEPVSWPLFIRGCSSCCHPPVLIQAHRIGKAREHVGSCVTGECFSLESAMRLRALTAALAQRLSL